MVMRYENSANILQANTSLCEPTDNAITSINHVMPAVNRDQV